MLYIKSLFEYFTVEDISRLNREIIQPFESCYSNLIIHIILCRNGSLCKNPFSSIKIVKFFHSRPFCWHIGYSIFQGTFFFILSGGSFEKLASNRNMGGSMSGLEGHDIPEFTHSRNHCPLCARISVRNGQEYATRFTLLQIHSYGYIYSGMVVSNSPEYSGDTTCFGMSGTVTPG